MGVPTEASRSPLRALMLAFEFPPLNSGGVHRALGFARTLPACGVELDVVTVQESDYASWTAAPVDHALVNRIPAAVRVHRVASGFPPWYWRLTAGPVGFRIAQYSYWGDPVSLFWRRPLFTMLDRLMSERRPDVVLATAPPFGVAVIARAVARRYRLPWVVDFRDAWTRWCVAPYPTVAHYAYARHAEHRILSEANAVVATSHVTRSEWLSDSPRLVPERLVTMYNGYDADGRAAPVAGHSDHTAEESREIITRAVSITRPKRVPPPIDQSGGGARSNGFSTACAGKTGCTGRPISSCLDSSGSVSAIRGSLRDFGSPSRAPCPRGWRRCWPRRGRPIGRAPRRTRPRRRRALGAAGRRCAAHLG